MTRKGIKGFITQGAVATALGVIGTTVATPAQAEVTFSTGNFNVAFEHIGFDTLVRGTPGLGLPLADAPVGSPPSISGTPVAAIEESAFYSARALALIPVIPDFETIPGVPIFDEEGDPEPRLISSWLHGFGSRWIIEHKLSDLDPVANGRSSDWRDLQAHAHSLSGNDAQASRLFSNFETSQHQAKSLVWDTGADLARQVPDGRLYAAVNQGAFFDEGPNGDPPTIPLPLNKIFIYGHDLSGSEDFPDPGGVTASGSQFSDINLDTVFPTGDENLAFVPEGVTSVRNGDEALLFVSNRNPNNPSIAVFDISRASLGGPSPQDAPQLANGELDLRPDLSMLPVMPPPIATLDPFGGDGLLPIAPDAVDGTSLRGMTASITDDATGAYAAFVADLEGNRIIRIAASDMNTDPTVTTIDLGGVLPGATPHHMTLGTVGGEEVLFITNRGGGDGDATTPSIIYVDTDDFTDLTAYKEIIPTISYGFTFLNLGDDGVPGGMGGDADFIDTDTFTGLLSDRFPDAYGFGDIVAIENADPNATTIDLLLTLEDAQEFHDLGPSSLDIFRDQILRVTLDLTFQGGGGGIGGNNAPEPGTLAVLGLGSLALIRRRRRSQR